MKKEIKSAFSWLNMCSDFGSKDDQKQAKILIDYFKSNDQLINDLVEALVFSLKENMCYSRVQQCIVESKCIINFDIKQCEYIKAVLLIKRAKEMMK